MRDTDEGKNKDKGKGKNKDKNKNKGGSKGKSKSKNHKTAQEVLDAVVPDTPEGCAKGCLLFFGVIFGLITILVIWDYCQPPLDFSNITPKEPYKLDYGYETAPQPSSSGTTPQSSDTYTKQPPAAEHTPSPSLNRIRKEVQSLTPSEKEALMYELIGSVDIYEILDSYGDPEELIDYYGE